MLVVASPPRRVDGKLSGWRDVSHARGRPDQRPGIGEMKTREFLENLPDLVRQQLPPELKDFQTVAPMGSLVKLHYGVRQVHYEVWVRTRKREVELGLHFEGDPQSNLRHLALLREHGSTIRSALGPGVAIEEWDKGWTRLHETVPLEPLTMDFLVEVSFRLSEVMQTLEPLVRAGAERRP